MAVIGDSASLNVTAIGPAPLNYQWRLNGIPLTVATNSSLSFPSVQAVNFGTYTVVVSNFSGSVTSAPVTLTVIAPAPMITQQPQSITVPLGTAATFTVGVVGSAPFTYQWMLSGTNLPGVTNATLTIPNTQAGNTGDYTVTVSNSAGTAVSGVATLGVYPAATIISQPQAQNAVASGSATFTVGVGGSPPFTYRWRFNGTNLTNSARISGATTGTLVVSGVTSNDAGNYSVVVTNISGSTISSNAPLTYAALLITGQPQGFAANLGAFRTMEVVVSSALPVTYQWRRNGTNVSGQTYYGLSLVLGAGQAGNYTVVVANSAGSVTSAVATVSINQPPAITSGPTNRAVNLGGNSTFTVAVTGTAPFTYQWYFNVTNALAGATNAAFSLTNAQPADAGTYSVAVTNVAGSVVSTPASLAVIVPPAITGDPTNQTVNPGQNASFNVVASGTAPLAYQWRLNGAPLPGATNASLTLSNLAAGFAAGYSVVVTNAAGSVTSAVATLLVNLPVVLTSQPQGQVAVAGTNFNLLVSATGTGPLFYQWQLNGLSLTDATNASLSLAGIAMSDAGAYRVQVSNVVNAVTSAPAQLTVARSYFAPPPRQTVQEIGAGGFQFVLALEVGRVFRVQSSSDLVNWLDVTNFTSDASTLLFLDTTATNRNLRFYRVVSP